MVGVRTAEASGPYPTLKVPVVHRGRIWTVNDFYLHSWKKINRELVGSVLRFFFCLGRFLMSTGTDVNLRCSNESASEAGALIL